MDKDINEGVYMKKFFSKTFIVCPLFIMLSGVSVIADSGTKMSFDFDAGTKGAWLDGSVNNKYYNLSEGKVSLQDLGYTISGSGSSFTISLYRERIGPDKNYGTKSASKNMEWSIDTNSKKYYFYLYGRSSYGGINIYGSGYVHDHGL